MGENLIREGWPHKINAKCMDCGKPAWVILGVCKACWEEGLGPEEQG